MLLCLLLAGCGVSESDVRQEIARANRCDTVADCVDVGSYCPYGCTILVNRAEAPRIRDLLMRSSNNTCQYDCAQVMAITCDAGACVARYQ